MILKFPLQIFRILTTIPNRQNMYFRFRFLINDKIVADDLNANVFNIGSLTDLGMHGNQLNSLFEKLVKLPAVCFGLVSVNPIF
ncbi:hypothetical protein D3C86_2106720 [compost metagenome]